MHIDPLSRSIRLNYCTYLIMVRSGDLLLTESKSALILQENGHPPQYYFPKLDVLMKHLTLSDHVSTCPHKGRAIYYHCNAPEGRLENIAWCYPAAKLPVAEISGYIAFYEEKLDVIVL